MDNNTDQISSRTYCPTCGSEVEVRGGDEGTHYYVPKIPAPPVSGEKAYRWVKASERLPGFDKIGGWKKKHIYRYTIALENATCCKKGTRITSEGEHHMVSHALNAELHGSMLHQDVEWLEEITLPAVPVKKVEEETE